MNDAFEVALLVAAVNVLRAKDDFVERLDAVNVVKLVDISAVVGAVIASDGSNVAAIMTCGMFETMIAGGESHKMRIDNGAAIKVADGEFVIA